MSGFGRLARLVASTHAKRVRFPHPAPVFCRLASRRCATLLTCQSLVRFLRAAAISKPLHLGWNRTVDPVSDEFESRWRRQNRPSCGLLHEVTLPQGTCNRAALDANIEHGACIYPSRWDGGESYTLAGVGSIPTSGTSQWVVQIRSGGRSSGCKPDPFRARGSIPSMTHHFYLHNPTA